MTTSPQALIFYDHICSFQITVKMSLLVFTTTFLCARRIRRNKSLFFSGKSCHLVLLGHCLYCYPLGSSKPPFSELDLSSDAQMSIHNSITFSIKDQTWTTYMFQAETTEDRNTWLSALRHVEGLGR